tara:strand:+ start:678 stop:920 length:243 start_codon:yes stop_codon:yes gene_type:complete
MMTFAWNFTPKHEKMTPTQTKRELKAINISLEELPLIKRSDAAIQILIEQGIEIDVNDVIKINRSTKTGKEVSYYRKVAY